MSKAFTREDDSADEPILPRPSSSLPPGVKNYITADGAKKLREELDRMIHVERPRIAALPDAAEAKRQLQILDQRIASLGGSLQSAVVVPSPVAPDDTVRFGASVTVRESSGSQSVYRIVGVDETDLDRAWVSWRSPIARALLNARVGQRVRFKIPSGEEILEILSIKYD